MDVVLLGRAGECRAVEAVLASVGEPAALVLVIRGPIGIGRTALLEWAVRAAPSMRALSVRGSELDPRIRWSALTEVVAALERGIPALLPWQAEVLRGAVSGSADLIDPMAVGVSLVELFSSVASSPEPLMVAVDDADAIDPASLDALAFAARRIDYEPVVMFFTVEDDEQTGLAESFRVVDVAGLSPIDAVTLLAGRVETEVAAHLARLSGGNPLAMQAIATQLTPEQRAGVEPLSAVLPLGEVLLRGFARRTEGLSIDQRRLLVMVAADPGLESVAYRMAASAADIDPLLVETIVKPGLLLRSGDARLWFDPPLLRHAVYETATLEDRRFAHRALAAACRDDAGVDRRAWHLAEGAEGPDPVASGALEELAIRASDSGDPGEPGAALMRAAELSERRDDAMRRLAAAGAAFALGDLNDRAVDAFDRALVLTDDLAEQAEIQIARAGPRLALTGSPRGYVELAELANRIESVDVVRASTLNVLAALTALAAGDIRSAVSMCDRAVAQAPDAGLRAASMAQALAALLSTLTGDCSNAARVLLDLGEPDHHEIWIGRSTLAFEDVVAEALAWLGKISASSQLVDALVEESRAADAIVLLARALAVRADLYLRTGYWVAALSDANESADFAAEIGAPASGAFALAGMARVEARLGRGGDALRHGHAALETAQRCDLGVTEFWAQGALGFLALTQGNGHQAISSLEAARAFAAREHITLLVAVPWAPDLVEAYIRAGRVPEARRLVAELDAHDVRSQGALAAALLSRCRGLVEPAEPDGHFRAALAAHADVLAPFERARTELVYGEVLRRERRPTEAVP